MKIPFKERLTQFAREKYDAGQNKFEAMCGIPRGTINGITKGISTATLEPIAEACPELNLRWLLTGKGNMCVGEDSEDVSKALEIAKEVEVLKENIAKLEETIKRQDDVIRSLSTYVASINSLKDGEDIHRG